MQSSTLTVKRCLTAAIVLLCAVYLLNGSAADARQAGPPGARTGAPAFGSIAAETTCTACHASNPSVNPVNAPGGVFQIVAPSSYAPGTDVQVKVRLAREGVVKFGFQLTALDESGNKAGELVLAETTRTQLQTVGARQYVAHTLAGTAGLATGDTNWDFIWRPPATAVGRVVFYAAGNATNSSNSNAGDFVYTTSKAIYAPGFTPQAITAVSAASFSPIAASESIMALFGTSLNPTEVSASTVPLPTTLGGLRVVVHDMTTHIERDAPLFYVGPNQINFQIPAGVTNGPATLSVLRDNTAFASGNITVTGVAPALFTFNANGQGVPAANALRIKGTAQTTEAIAQLSGSRYEPIPIDLGATDEQVYVVAFGTGFRNRGVGGTVSATIGGTNADVVAGAQGQLVGLDQANILIPRSLAGRGLVNVVLTVNGQAANTVQINIK